MGEQQLLDQRQYLLLCLTTFSLGSSLTNTDKDQ